jgi:hypothetical protein
MFSFPSIRKVISHNSSLVGLLCLFFLILSSFGGFIHNHSDDPLHLKPHDDCPASVWYYSPFTIGIAVISILVIRFILQKVFYSYSTPVLEEYSFVSFSRAPPLSA